jgi:hypothetical protein
MTKVAATLMVVVTIKAKFIGHLHGLSISHAFTLILTGILAPVRKYRTMKVYGVCRGTNGCIPNLGNRCS